MNSSELKAACEMAGGEAEHDDGELSGYWFRDNTQFLEIEHDALPAYVAELLTAKVRRLDSYDVELVPMDDDGTLFWLCTIWYDGGHKKADGQCNKDEDNGKTVAVIRAAMAVLKGGG